MLLALMQNCSVNSSFAVKSALLSVVFIVAFWFTCMGGNSHSNMSSPVIIPATAKHTATVIFLHGLGDTGHGWASALQSIRAPHIKYVCPTASTIPVSLNGGLLMPSWFDLYSLSEGPEDATGIRKAADYIHSLISEEEKHGIPSTRIILGGFSQGGALSFYSAYTLAKPIAGIVGLSSWLPLNKSFPGCIKGNAETPVFQCHGDMDPLVSYRWGELTSQFIKSFSKSHEFKTYKNLGHSSNEEEMQDVRQFISSRLPEN